MLVMVLVLYGISVVFFFFFKQKTAYEMRISDWSSDVCSSDLGLVYVVGREATAQVDHLQLNTVFVAQALEDDLHLGDRRIPRADVAQIGRASCRERVCQYV